MEKSSAPSVVYEFIAQFITQTDVMYVMFVVVLSKMKETYSIIGKVIRRIGIGLVCTVK